MIVQDYEPKNKNKYPGIGSILQTEDLEVEVGRQFL